jgi:hypothetical protein
MQVKCKKNAILAIALVAAVFTGTIAAQTFYLIWIQTPFEPVNYSWQQPWEVKEMVDFIEATLTLEGCGYEGQSHDAELVIKNVATTPNLYAVDFDYLCKWFVDETHQENIFAGLYEGLGLAPGENVTYTKIWIPTVVGVGSIKLNIIDIIWKLPEPITWTKTITGKGASGTTWQISDFQVTGGSMSVTESGTVSFTCEAKGQTITLNYELKIVELGLLVGSGTKQIGSGMVMPFSHDFDPLLDGGTYTMELNVISVT